MRSRGVVLAVAVVVATLAATAVAVYVQGVRADAQTGGGEIGVLHAIRDVAAGTSADELIAEGAFEVRAVTRAQMVAGAVTDDTELTGKRTTSPILAGEQVTMARFDGGDVRLGGGALGLSPGYQAVAVSLDPARAAGGAIQPGDHVTVYATFTTADQGEVTVTLVPDAEVVATSGGAIGTASSPQTIITVALKPAKAQRLVFAQERGSIWFALLAPNESGTDGGAVSFPEATE